MAAIYGLQMETVNYLIHKGLVDPTLTGRVPLQSCDYHTVAPRTADQVTIEVTYQGKKRQILASTKDTVEVLTVGSLLAHYCHLRAGTQATVAQREPLEGCR